MDYHEEIIVPSTRKPTERCVYVRLLLSISPVVSTLAWQFNNPAPKKKLLEKFRKKEEEAMKKRNRIREMRNKFATNKARIYFKQSCNYSPNNATINVVSKPAEKVRPWLGIWIV
ncbi:15481_t:CDS:2 [Funneliformis geosporum]|uniref:15481_t:CDS:1 n=1 Tax=Funneliformis geosporum TaxID=1117311 RepID=A0A9W4WZZ4_9GLOM|nr:15481_t:CDS:2 [Funneliformis geosporum]